MNHHLNRRTLVSAIVACGLGSAGLALAADYATKPSTPSASTQAATSSTATTPSSALPSKSELGRPEQSAAAVIAPSKSETPDSAFKKLDTAGKGYITMEQAKAVPDFDKYFQQYDANHDGRLTMNEFKGAWAAYSGNKG